MAIQDAQLQSARDRFPDRSVRSIQYCKSHWIEIVLKDTFDEPVPHEAYIVRSASGQEVSGTLDANGEAHVALRSSDPCNVIFPELDVSLQC